MHSVFVRFPQAVLRDGDPPGVPAVFKAMVTAGIMATAKGVVAKTALVDSSGMRIQLLDVQKVEKMVGKRFTINGSKVLIEYYSSEGPSELVCTNTGGMDALAIVEALIGLIGRKINGRVALLSGTKFQAEVPSYDGAPGDWMTIFFARPIGFKRLEFPIETRSNKGKPFRISLWTGSDKPKCTNCGPKLVWYTRFRCPAAGAVPFTAPIAGHLLECRPRYLSVK